MSKKTDLSATVAATVRGAFQNQALPTPPVPLHPAGEGMSRLARSDTFSLDPKRIVIEGFYVREPDDDEDFGAFCDTLRVRGEIDIPLSVRTSGPVTSRKYILVWGRRRLTAALQLGFPMVPVRTFGDISETEAIKLQLQENLNRRAMTPAETAHAFWELTTRGLANVEIARTYGKTESYVSYLVKTGEALAQLDVTERRALNRSGALKVRVCQDIAKQGSLPHRVAALRTLAASAATGPAPTLDDEEPAPARSRRAPGKKRVAHTRRRDEERPFIARDLRNGEGRSFRVRWTDRDLDANPEEFVRRLSEALGGEVERLAARLEERKASADAGSTLDPKMTAQFEAARATAIQLATWLPAAATRR